MSSCGGTRLLPPVRRVLDSSAATMLRILSRRRAKDALGLDRLQGLRDPLDIRVNSRATSISVHQRTRHHEPDCSDEPEFRHGNRDEPRADAGNIDVRDDGKPGRYADESAKRHEC